MRRKRRVRTTSGIEARTVAACMVGQTLVGEAVHMGVPPSMGCVAGSPLRFGTSVSAA